MNAPKLSVVSGPAEAIEGLAILCEARSIPHRRPRTSHAFHSRMMDPMLAAFIEQVRQVELHPPRIPYVSNLTGTWITAEQATDPQYWVQHLRQPVRFADGIRELAQASRYVLLEAGPGRTLAMLARQQIAADSGQLIVTSLRHPQSNQPDRAHLLTAVARLWLANVPITWQSLPRERPYRVPLPTYPYGAIDVTPVDYVSKALVYLSLHAPRSAPAFHLVNPQPTRLAQIADWLRGFGYTLEIVPADQWQAALTRLLETDSQDNVLYPLLAMLRTPEAAGMEPPAQEDSAGVQYDCRHTLTALADTAIRCPTIDHVVLKHYLNYLIASGYLAAPNAQDNYDVTT